MENVADTGGITLPRNAVYVSTDAHIAVASRKTNSGPMADPYIVRSCRIAAERIITTGAVPVARCVENERTTTIRSVEGADCVLPERGLARGRVVTAGSNTNRGTTEKRVSTDSRVRGADCVVM
jgi:hypothetical protein